MRSPAKNLPFCSELMRLILFSPEDQQVFREKILATPPPTTLPLQDEARRTKNRRAMASKVQESAPSKESHLPSPERGNESGPMHQHAWSHAKQAKRCTSGPGDQPKRACARCAGWRTVLASRATGNGCRQQVPCRAGARAQAPLGMPPPPHRCTAPAGSATSAKPHRRQN